jgi:HSP20 family protein
LAYNLLLALSKNERKGEIGMINHIFRGQFTDGFRPDVDIVESDNEYIFKFDIPGAQRNDIKIWLENDILVISGEKKALDNSERLIAERSFGRFERSFRLPGPVDRNKVTAELVDGVLSIAISKVITTKEISII